MSRALLFALLLNLPLLAADWYVSPTGAEKNPGTKDKPWDIGTALGGGQKIAPGDTVFLLEGTYKQRPKEQIEVRLAGTAEKPVHVRPAPNARVTIDGGFAVQAPTAHLWMRDLEILVSEPHPEKPISAGSHPEDFKRPWGGLNCAGGRNCKYINLVIHDCRQGMSVWKGEIDCEIYGCVVYDNGWPATDRGHGHCLYTQNLDGTKSISNCIMTCKHDGTYTMHAYGSAKADVDNYLVEDSIFYGTGKFLIGGGKPSHNIRVFRNLLYNQSMRIGYDAKENEDCEIRDNFIFNGGLEIKNYKKAVNENNTVLKKGDKLPAEPRIVLLPNKYDEKRAHLAICNFANANTVNVDVSKFLKKGESFKLFDPKKLFDKPVFEGKCEGETIAVPVSGEFAVFVVLK
jgi:hypothetical protein